MTAKSWNKSFLLPYLSYSHISQRRPFDPKVIGVFNKAFLLSKGLLRQASLGLRKKRLMRMLLIQVSTGRKNKWKLESVNV
jgi:hypothetical protein